MNQYEERLRRSSEYLEQSQQDYSKVQEEMKLLQEKTQVDLKSRDTFLTELIQKSTQVKAKVHRAFDKKQLNENQMREALNDIELGVA